MNKTTLSPVSIVIASALYFLIASLALSHDSSTVNFADSNPIQINSLPENSSAITFAVTEVNIEKKYTGMISHR